MRNPFRRFERVDFPTLVVLSLIFFALVVWVFVRERDTDWRPFQEQFVAVLERYGQLKAARSFHPGIRQLWIPDLHRVDRCVTCHLGYEWNGTLPADLPEPFTPHPDLPYMHAHPFQQFGCTSCHAGQGFATEKDAAHGHVAHWDEPLITKALAASYGVTRAVLMQVRCNECHRRDRTTDGLGVINRAKALFTKRKCLVCHTVQGRGGATGPELTYVGDKNPELFDFSHVTGRHTLLNWHVQHLLDPDVVSPNTEMPPYGFSEDEARGLALLLLSWKKLSLPPRYIPGPPQAAVPKAVHARPIPPVVLGAEQGRAAFLKRGCHTCHAVGAKTGIGPDLRGVRQRRTRDWLRQWLADPAAMVRAEPELADWPAQYGGIIMPNQNLSATEIQALVKYLEGL
ncbi:MAG: c-type cytochrome [Candidatus Binatia bacterium]